MDLPPVPRGLPSEPRGPPSVNPADVQAYLEYRRQLARKLSMIRDPRHLWMVDELLNMLLATMQQESQAHPTNQPEQPRSARRRRQAEDRRPDAGGW